MVNFDISTLPLLLPKFGQCLLVLAYNNNKRHFNARFDHKHKKDSASSSSPFSCSIFPMLVRLCNTNKIVNHKKSQLFFLNKAKFDRFDSHTAWVWEIQPFGHF